MERRLAVALNGYGLTREDGAREVMAWHDVVQIAGTAEETGYDAIFTPEIGAREAFSTLTGFAGATSRIRLVTGVVPIGSRDPRRMAMEAATVHDLAPDRFVLGLGSRLSIEDTRRHVEAVRALLAGEEPPVIEPGTVVAGPLDLFPGRLPIFLAALGPRMTALAGEVADGVILNWCTPDRVAAAREEVARGAETAGRDPASVTVCVYVRTCIGHEEAHALEALEAATAQYAAMPSYSRQLERLGLGREAERAAAGSVPRTLVAAVCAWGSRDEALARLGAYHEAGADSVVVYPVPVLDAMSSILGTVLGAAPRTAVER